MANFPNTATTPVDRSDYLFGADAATIAGATTDGAVQSALRTYTIDDIAPQPGRDVWESLTANGNVYTFPSSGVLANYSEVAVAVNIGPTGRRVVSAPVAMIEHGAGDTTRPTLTLLAGYQSTAEILVSITRELNTDTNTTLTITATGATVAVVMARR